MVREAEAPWGSQSHHFPGGKVQLASEALERGGQQYREVLEAALADTHPAAMVESWAALARASHDSEPLRLVGEQLAVALRAQVP